MPPRGRGRGGFGGGGFGGPRRPLPFQPIETYEYNPNCEFRTELNEEEHRFILFNRLIRRHFAMERGKTLGRVTERLIEGYQAGRAGEHLSDPQVYLRHLVQSVGQEFFPVELLSSTYNPARSRQRQDQVKKLNWAALEKGDKVGVLGVGAEGGAVDEDLDEPEADQASDFGDEDYAEVQDEDRDYFQDSGGDDE